MLSTDVGGGVSQVATTMLNASSFVGVRLDDVTATPLLVRTATTGISVTVALDGRDDGRTVTGTTETAEAGSCRGFTARARRTIELPGSAPQVETSTTTRYDRARSDQHSRHEAVGGRKALMSRHYGRIAFTEDVVAEQERNGSGMQYAAAGGAAAAAPVSDRLGPAERAFLAERDGFYLASTGATGWPYVQYRGGSPGFLRVLDDATLGWADFGGNLQYVSTGNVAGDDRVALIVMDYAGQRRLKVYGRARVQDASAAPDLVRVLADVAVPSVVERVVTVAVAAYDWNCPRHIVRRFTARELQPQVLRLVSEVEALRDENRALRDQLQQAVAPGREG